MNKTELEKDLLKVAEKQKKELELINLLLDKSTNLEFSDDTQQNYHFAAYWTSQAFKYYDIVATFASESFYAKAAKEYQQKAEEASIEAKEFFTKNSDNYVF